MKEKLLINKDKIIMQTLFGNKEFNLIMKLIEIV